MKRSDPWLTSFVDCSPDGPGSLLGWLLAAPERVCGSWACEPRSPGSAIKIVVIDESTTYLIRTCLRFWRKRATPLAYARPLTGLTNQDSAKILPQILLSSDKSAQGAGLSANFARYWILGPHRGRGSS
jgi:hypothetical protein